MIKTRETDVQRYAVRLRSDIHRSAYRATRLGRRPDNKIMAAWVLRCARRGGACPVADPTWTYDPGLSGPKAIQTATVRCLVPADDAERRLFDGLRLPGHLHRFRYIHPDEVRSPALALHRETARGVGRDGDIEVTAHRWDDGQITLERTGLDALRSIEDPDEISRCVD